MGTLKSSKQEKQLSYNWLWLFRWFLFLLVCNWLWSRRFPSKM